MQLNGIIYASIDLSIALFICSDRDPIIRKGTEEVIAASPSAGSACLHSCLPAAVGGLAIFINLCAAAAARSSSESDFSSLAKLRLTAVTVNRGPQPRDAVVGGGGGGGGDVFRAASFVFPPKSR